LVNSYYEIFIHIQSLVSEDVVSQSHLSTNNNMTVDKSESVEPGLKIFDCAVESVPNLSSSSEFKDILKGEIIYY
jgi:hypothetical protein